jgi:hypothetical protein
MEKSNRSTPRVEGESAAEDLGEDVLVLASVAATRGKASVVRNVNGVLVRVIVEAA